VRATIAGLRALRTPEEVAALRGRSIAQVLGLVDGPRGGAAPAANNGQESSAPAAPALAGEA